MKAKLYYVYDPMCSWCWGFRPTWLALEDKLKNIVDVHYKLGGLAEDSNVEMPMEMQDFLKKTWCNIAEQLGTEFNFNFWCENTPKRSTYPACRAILVARIKDKEREMFAAIQQAYYLKALNPSDNTVLVNIASEVGLHPGEFELQLSSDAIKAKLIEEVNASRAMPIQGFPSLVLSVDGEFLPIPVDYKNWQTSYDIILKYLK